MSETVITILFAVLLLVIVILSALLARLLPLLHDSVSKSNLGLFYNAALPTIKNLGGVVVDETIDGLQAVTARTSTKLDDELLNAIEGIVRRAMQNQNELRKVDEMIYSNDEETTESILAKMLHDAD